MDAKQGAGAGLARVSLPRAHEEQRGCKTDENPERECILPSFAGGEIGVIRPPMKTMRKYTSKMTTFATLSFTKRTNDNTDDDDSNNPTNRTSKQPKQLQRQEDAGAEILEKKQQRHKRAKINFSRS